jgi:hypothetical protein
MIGDLPVKEFNKIDDIDFQINMDRYQKDYDEAKKCGLTKQMSIAQKNIDNFKKIKEIKDNGFSEIINIDAIYHNSLVIEREMTWQEKFKCDYTSYRRHYARVKIEQYDKSIPHYIMQKYIEFKGLFDAIEILDPDFESPDPYLVGVLNVPGERGRRFVIASWAETREMP